MNQTLKLTQQNTDVNTPKTESDFCFDFLNFMFLVTYTHTPKSLKLVGTFQSLQGLNIPDLLHLAEFNSPFFKLFPAMTV